MMTRFPLLPQLDPFSIAYVQTFINYRAKQRGWRSCVPIGFHISRLLFDLRSFLIIAFLWVDILIIQALQVPWGNASHPLVPFSTPSHPQSVICSISAVGEDILGGFLVPVLLARREKIPFWIPLSIVSVHYMPLLLILFSLSSLPPPTGVSHY